MIKEINPRNISNKTNDPKCDTNDKYQINEDVYPAMSSICPLPCTKVIIINSEWTIYIYLYCLKVTYEPKLVTYVNRWNEMNYVCSENHFLLQIVFENNVEFKKVLNYCFYFLKKYFKDYSGGKS